MNFKIKTKLRKMNIPLNYFEKLSELTPSQVRYLEDYHFRVKIGKGNPALLERIGTILRKPHIEDPIFNKKFESKFNELYPPKKKSK